MRPALLVALLALAAARPLHAQCDPGGNLRPVAFISSDRYAEQALSAKDSDTLVTTDGVLPSPGTWTRWWSDGQIKTLCQDPKARGNMSVAACIAVSAHQNAIATLITVVGELRGLTARIHDKPACTVPAGAKARAFWSCLGGFPLPASFTLAFKVKGKDVVQATVAGSFLRGTPAFALRGETVSFGCGHAGWSVMQDAPLDWGSEIPVLSDADWLP